MIHSFLLRSEKSIRNWQLLEWLVLIAVVIGAFFRLFNLGGALQFLGDQGRDVLIVARIFKELDPVFIGPVTSVGNMYLGPLYYYFMLPWLWLTYPNPMGPQYAIAVLGILTNWLVWVLGKRMVGRWPAALATLLYACSHTVVEYTRFSWNPNPIPLVSLLMVYSTFQAANGKYWHWVLVGVYGSIILQLHYLAALTGIAASIVWIYQLYSIRKNKTAILSSLRAATLAGLIVLASFLPLFLFDMKNGWLNARAFTELITGSENFGSQVESTFLVELLQTIKESHGRSMHFLFEIFIGKQRVLNSALVVVYGAVFCVLFGSRFRKALLKNAPGVPVLLVWLLVGILGTSLYKHTVFDHYIGFAYPVSILISGFVLVTIARLHRLLIVPVVLCVIGFIAFNVQRMPLRDAGLTFSEMQEVSNAIAQRVISGEKYNIVLFSHSKDLYGMNYRYFLETTEQQPVREANWTEAETLFIIDEERTGRDVISAPVHEIITFPSKEPVEMFEVNAVRVWVLRANKS